MGLFKNEVGRPSNETIKKRNIFKGVCFVLVLIIIGLAVLLLNKKGVININSNSNQGNNNTSVKTDDKIENLDVESDEVKNLFNKYNVFTSFLDIISNDESSICYDTTCYAYFYNNESLSSDSLNEEIKFVYSLANLYGYEFNEYGSVGIKLSENNEISLDSLNEKSVNLFNSKIDFKGISDKINKISVNSISEGRMNFEYDSNKKIISVKLGGGVGDCSSQSYKTKIIQAQRIGNKIEIYNKVMFMAGGCNADNYVSNKILDINNIKDYIDKKDNNTWIIDDYLDKLDSFKWTFVKDKDGNYTFKSVEKVNN